MKEKLEQYVKDVEERREQCRNNEEQTKHSLIAPLFTILGYSMTDPRECKPEYRTSFGKGAKAATPVDWAFLINAVLAFFVEAKEAGAKLTKYPEQLGMYFSKEPGPKGVKLGILTSGAQWHFFTDLLHENAMDKEPFFTWDVLKDGPAISADLLTFLTLLQKSKFSPHRIKEFAKKKREQTTLVGILDRLLKPSPEFVKLALGTSINDAGDKIAPGAITARVIEQWTPKLKDATHDWAKQQALTVQPDHSKNPASEPETTKDKVRQGKRPTKRKLTDLDLKDVLSTSHTFSGLKNPQEKRENARMLSKAIETLSVRTGAGENAYQTHSASLDFLNRHKKLERFVRHIFEENKNRGISLLRLSPGEMAAACYLMASGKSDGDAYRNGNPPSEKGLDWSLQDKAENFFVELVLAARNKGADKKKLGALGEVVLALAGLAEDETGLAGHKQEKFAIIARAWEWWKDAAPNATLPKSVVKLEYHQTKDNGTCELVEFPTFGGIDIGPDRSGPLGG